MAETQPVGAAGEAVASGPRREILIVLPGLLLALILAMLDQTIVSTALPRIVGDLGGVTHLSWVVTAYVLASTVTTPLYGKLGDLYGRKRWLVTAIVIFLGAGVRAVAVAAIVLLTTWGGARYAWGSAPIVGLGVLAVAAAVAFLLTETRAAEPVLPLHVFRNRNFSLASGMSFLAGVAMLGALTFLPLYQQTVQHLSAIGSGLMLIPMMAGVTATSLIGGGVVDRGGPAPRRAALRG